MNLFTLVSTACLALHSLSILADDSPFHGASVELQPANPLSHLAEIDSDKTYLSKTGLFADDTIVLSLPRPLEEDTVVGFASGRIQPDDMFKQEFEFDGGVLEYSRDGTTWKQAGTRQCEVIAGTLPAGVRQIRLRATRNVPHPVLLGSLRILEAHPVVSKRKTITHQGRDIELEIEVQIGGNHDLRPQVDAMIDMYFTYWPILVDLLGSPVDDTTRHLRIILRDGIPYPGFADSENGRIVIKTEHLRANKADAYGLFQHELTHIIQRYPKYYPVWFVEGVADYTRFALSLDDDWKKKFMDNVEKRDPMGSYSASAGFLLYLEDTYQKDILRQVSIAARNDTYEKGIWEALTGKPLEQLCVDYIKDTAWTPGIPDQEH